MKNAEARNVTRGVVSMKISLIKERENLIQLRHFLFHRKFVRLAPITTQFEINVDECRAVVKLWNSIWMQNAQKASPVYFRTIKNRGIITCASQTQCWHVHVSPKRSSIKFAWGVREKRTKTSFESDIQTLSLTTSWRNINAQWWMDSIKMENVWCQQLHNMWHTRYMRVIDRT